MKNVSHVSVCVKKQKKILASYATYTHAVVDVHSATANLKFGVLTSSKKAAQSAFHLRCDGE
jgi:hypothetical protein